MGGRTRTRTVEGKGRRAGREEGRGREWRGMGEGSEKKGGEEGWRRRRRRRRREREKREEKRNILFFSL
jgi:hypothetical protein